MPLDVIDLGLMEYDAAWTLQQACAEEIAAGRREPTLLLLEHPHVYTFGTSGDAAHLLWDEAQRRERGVSLRWVDRGGDVTYHGPGQLVGYPLLPLGRIQVNAAEAVLPPDASTRIPRADYVGYVRRLERGLIAALAAMGIAAGQMQRLTGVWVQADVFSRCPRCRPEDRRKPAKIAAIGVKVDSRGISRHGFALNVKPDMSYWEGIIPCGMAEYPLVSMADLLPVPPPMQEVKRRVATWLGEALGLEIHNSGFAALPA